MDSLIGILILIGIFALSSKKQKKKAQKRPPCPAEPHAAHSKIPFTKAEWTAFLADMEAQEAKPKPSAKPRSAKPPKATTADNPTRQIQTIQAEGSISTQGESAAEHAEHQRKMQDADMYLQKEQEALQELRQLNRQKLRNAVVMSEILGKPVALRSRTNR